MARIIVTGLFFGFIIALIFYSVAKRQPVLTNMEEGEGSVYEPIISPLEVSFKDFTIEAQRKKAYPGSEITTVKTLPDGANYKRYIVSYLSDGLTIYAYLTVPKSTPPQGGFPAIIFNHGYIPPEEYKTAERYAAYTAALSRSGYVVLMPDYRGHGESGGQPTGAYFNPGYTTDVLNAVASIKKYPSVNPKKVGMWGHSMGGFLTLRSMVIDSTIKAGVIWAGVVGSYEDMYSLWWSRRERTPWSPSKKEQEVPGRRRSQDIIREIGQPNGNNFWRSISANYHLQYVSGPLQIHHGTGDATVPWELSLELEKDLKEAQKPYELYTYKGGDHNLSGAHFTAAMKRTIEFFDTHVK